MTSLIKIIGPTKGLKPGFITKINDLGDALGGTQLRITSGYRDPQHNADVGGVPRSNHLTGDAVDAYITIGGKEIPFGTAALQLASKYGLRSGDVPGFYNGQPDTVHVDDAANQGASTVATTRQTAGTNLALPPALVTAIQIAAAKFKVPASVLAGIWARETGSKFPNPYANGLGYGGLFGTSVSKPFGSASDVRRVPVPTTQAQANLAAGILARLIREKGSLGAALLAYSGGGYSSVPGGTVSADASAGGSGAGAGGSAYTVSDFNGPDIAGSSATGTYPAGYGASGGTDVVADKPLSIYERAAQAYIAAMKGPMTRVLPRARDPFGGERSPKVVKASKTTAAPTNVGGYDLGSLLTQANSQALTNAQATVAAQVKAYQDARDFEIQQGQNKAAAIAAASEAAAKYLQPFGQLADQQYQDAITNEERYARGFSGQASQDVSAGVDQMNRDLAAAGSPRTIQDPGATLGDVLYGLSATIPGRLLGAQGGAAAAQAAAMPFSALAQGQEGQTAARAAANEAASQYTQKILDANANLPATIASFKKDALSTAIQLAGLQKPIITKDGLGRVIAINPLTGAVTNLGGGTTGLGAGGVSGLSKPIKVGNQLIAFDANNKAHVLFTGTSQGHLYKFGDNLVDSNGKVVYQGPTTLHEIRVGKDIYIRNPDTRPGQPLYIEAIKGPETPPKLIRDAATGYEALYYPDRAKLVVQKAGTLPVSQRPTLKQAADGSYVLWDPVTQTQLDPGGKLGTATVKNPPALQVGVDAQGYKIQYRPDLGAWVHSVDGNGNWIKVKKTTAAAGPGSKTWQSSIGQATRLATTFASTKPKTPVISSGKSIKMQDVYPGLRGTPQGNKIYQTGGKVSAPFANAYATLVSLNDDPRWPLKAFQILTARKAFSSTDYSNAMEALTGEGITVKAADRFLRTLSPYRQEGVNGTPFTDMKAAKASAVATLALWRRQGESRAKAVQDMHDTGVYTQAVIEDAADAVYGKYKVGEMAPPGDFLPLAPPGFGGG